VVRRATPTRVYYLRELSHRNVRRRTSSEEGAAVNMCSRVLIALCIPAGLFAMASLVPRPSPAVVACRDSQDPQVSCWRGAKGGFTLRETTDASGARHLARRIRSHHSDVETTASLASAEQAEAVPLPPPRPKDLSR
jgi:hypothetical protein